MGASGSRRPSWISLFAHTAVAPFVHENVKDFIDGFRYDAHPMGMLVGTIGALSTFYPDAKHVLDLELRHELLRLGGRQFSSMVRSRPWPSLSHPSGEAIDSNRS